MPGPIFFVIPILQEESPPNMQPLFPILIPAMNKAHHSWLYLELLLKQHFIRTWASMLIIRNLQHRAHKETHKTRASSPIPSYNG